MRRRLALAFYALLCALLCLQTSWSSARAEAPGERKRITLWHAYRGAELEVLQQLLKEFEAGREDLERLMPPGYDPLLLFRTVPHNPRVLRRMRKGGLLDAGSIEPVDKTLPSC